MVLLASSYLVCTVDVISMKFDFGLLQFRFCFDFEPASIWVLLRLLFTSISTSSIPDYLLFSIFDFRFRSLRRLHLRSVSVSFCFAFGVDIDYVRVSSSTRVGLSDDVKCC